LQDEGAKEMSLYIQKEEGCFTWTSSKHAVETQLFCHLLLFVYLLHVISKSANLGIDKMFVLIQYEVIAICLEKILGHEVGIFCKILVRKLLELYALLFFHQHH